MGLFDFLKGKLGVPKYQKTTEDLKKENAEWFFAEEGEEYFSQCARNKTEMYSVRDDEEMSVDVKRMTISGWSLPVGSRARYEHVPCTFFADYFRAIGAFDGGIFSFYASDIALRRQDSRALGYPNGLKPEFNPLVKYAQFLGGLGKQYRDSITDSNAVEGIGVYINECFFNDENALDEGWILDKNLYVNENGIFRSDDEIRKLVKMKAQNKKVLAETGYFK